MIEEPNQDKPDNDKRKRRKSSKKNEAHKQLNQYEVILHDNDIVSSTEKLKQISKITRFKPQEAENKVRELEEQGKVVLLVTHLEKAEFLAYQFMNGASLQVTYVPLKND